MRIILKMFKKTDQEISEYLLSKGWKNAGPYQEVWKISNWDRSGECCMSLRKAYKLQQKWDSTNFVKPIGLDDDLGDLIAES